MRISFRWAAAIIASAIVSASAGPAQAQDHEKCYKIKDPAKIKGLVDLTTPQFGLESGCVIKGGRTSASPRRRRSSR